MQFGLYSLIVDSLYLCLAEIIYFLFLDEQFLIVNYYHRILIITAFLSRGFFPFKNCINPLNLTDTLNVYLNANVHTDKYTQLTTETPFLKIRIVDGHKQCAHKLLKSLYGLKQYITC